MIDIYAVHFNQNGSIQEQKTLIQTIPAADEGELFLISPKVSGKTGSADSFDFSVQPNTKYYDAFYQFKTYFFVEYDGDLVFYGRVLTIDKSLWGEQKIKCEGAFAFFNDSYYPGVPDSERPSRVTGDFVRAVLENHNSQLNDPMRAIYSGEIPGNYSAAISSDQMIEEETRTYGESGWQQTKSVLDDLTSHHGGMFRVRQGIDGRMYLDWMKHYFENEVSNQVIEVGKNIIDASSATEVNNIFTVVVPIGQGSEKKGNLYIDGMYFPVSRITEFYTDEELRSGYHLPEDYRNAYAQYGTIIKPIELQECTTKEALLSECAKWVKENYFGGIEEVSVTAVDFHQIGKNGNDVKKIISGGRYTVRFPVGNGVIKERTLTCTAATLELYTPENNQYTFGIPASSLKGYSVNSKKSKQDADNTEPEKFGGNSNYNAYHDWYNKRLTWLKRHRVWWKHLTQAERDHYPDVGLGPAGPNMNSCFIHDINILDADGDKQAEVWAPDLFKRTNVGTASEPKWVYVWRSDAAGNHPTGTWKRIKRKLLQDYAYDLRKNYLFEYVYSEWGFELSTDMPLNLTDLDGIIEEISGESGIFEYDGESVLNIGDRIKSLFSLDGLRSYFPQADAIITNIEKVAGKLGLTSVVEAGKTFIDSLGQSVTSFITNNEGITAITTMLQDSLGNLSFVNATVDGLTGNLKTEGDISFEDASGHPVSLRRMEIKQVNDGNKIGVISTKYFEDPEHPGDENYYKPVAYEFTQSIEDYLGGGDIIVARVEGDEVLIGNGKASEVVNRALHHVTDVVGDVELATDAQGNKYWKIKTGGGLHIEKNGVELGVWDEGSLTGGVMVQKVQDEVGGGDIVVAKLVGDEVQIGNSKTSQVITKALHHITDVVGDVELSTDSEGRRVWKIKSGGGLNVERDNVAFGLWDEGNLTGGVITAKVNNETETYIVGDRIQVGDKTGVFYSGYISDDHTNFYSDENKTIRIVGQTGKFYGDIPSDKVYTWNGSIFVETPKTLDLQTSSMKGIVATKATVTELNAVRARVGTLEADLVNADKIKARISSLDLVSVKSLQFLDGTTPYGSDRYTNVRALIHAVRVVSAGDSTYKLQYQTGNDGWSDTSWKDAGTFSKGVSYLSGDWNANVMTVSTNPNYGKTFKVSLGTTSVPMSGADCNLAVQGNGDPTRVSSGSKYWNAPFKIVTVVPGQPPTLTERYSNTFSFDSTPIVNAVTVSGPNWTTTGPTTGATNSVSVSKDGAIQDTQYTFMYADVNAKKAYIRYNNSSASVQTDGTIFGSADMSGIYNAGRSTGHDEGWNDGYDNAAGLVTIDGQSTINTSHPIGYGGRIDVVVPVNISGTRTTLTHSFTAPANNYQSGWNDGYDNAAGLVTVDGQSTINTSHPLGYDGRIEVVVPTNISGSRTTLTHVFTSPSDRYQSGWNDGYDNAAGLVTIDGQSTINTSHPIGYGGRIDVVVPVNISGTRSTLTHSFTAPANNYQSGWDDGYDNAAGQVTIDGIHTVNTDQHISPGSSKNVVVPAVIDGSRITLTYAFTADNPYISKTLRCTKIEQTYPGSANNYYYFRLEGQYTRFSENTNYTMYRTQW